jgi:hypothetical protein
MMGIVHDVHVQVHGVVSKWIDIEHAVERASYPLSLNSKRYQMPIRLCQVTLGPRQTAHAGGAVRRRSLTEWLHSLM